MLNWIAFAVLSVQAVLLVRASDGPIDWDKTPGGGPSKLRACARLPYTICCSQSVNAHLGCDTIRCLCRPDLIDKAHARIKDMVSRECGADATVDVEQALNIYNDYCSANGFAVPGYTFIITQTVKTLPREGTATGASSDASSTASGVASSSSTTNNREVLVTTTTAEANGILTVTATVTATATTPATTAATTTVALSSASPPIRSFVWFHLICFLVLIPIPLFFGLPQTSVVYFTPTPPPPAYTLVVTSFKTEDPTAPVISTKLVPYSSKRVPSSPTDAPNADENTSSSANDNGGRNNELSKLEVAGIVIGITVGLITGAATVWMCIRGGRGFPPFPTQAAARERREEHPLDDLVRSGNVHNTRNEEFIR
ncbi:hypothetical protein BKA66DRAFT_581779 [Pyrenochaeta sp. MPI-SDFR-AT-0127]|nr:hypothetical protein BKA66DRAFT_581779 [Pyrenochaeta sp. MPI-SDFR-AT-0127]